MARNCRRGARSCDSAGSAPLPRGSFAPRYWATWLLVAWMRAAACLPTRANLKTHKLLGRLAGRFFLARRARVVRRNLELCFPELAADEVDDLVRRHFEALAACIGEAAAAWFGPHDRLRAMLEVEGCKHLDAAIAEGRGVLLYTGHFTPLEITGPLLAGLTDRFAFVFNSRRNRVLDAIQWRGRARAASRFFPKDDARALLRGLRRNAVVWYAADEADTSSHGALVPFFGVPAMTNTAVSRIARLSGARVLPFSFRRRADDAGYVLAFEPPLASFPSCDAVADTRRLVERLELAIRRAPEQYMWAQKKFRGRPPPLRDVYAQPARPGRARRAPRLSWARLGSAPVNVLRGLAIGTAQLVPGLGSGTVALLVGAYQRLVRALARIDAVWLRMLMERRFGDALRRLDMPFVLPVAIGVLSVPVVVYLTLPLELLISEMPEMTFGFVFGLVAASIVSLIAGLDERRILSYAWLAAGVVLGCSLVLVVPVDTPSSGAFLFLCGVIAAVAILTPGLSASLALIVLGKYFDLLDALARGDWVILLPTAAGVFAGTALFARVMAWLLERYRQRTLLAVTGVVGGSLLAVWPFQDWVATEVGGRIHVVGAAPYMPEALDRGVVMGIAAMLAGIIAFRVLARLASSAAPLAVATRAGFRAPRDR